MSSWSDATEEKLKEDGYCDHCQQEIKAGESLWIHDDDVKCSQCKQKEIDQGS
ncbi:MAG: hypothetical protein KAT04_09160 [Methylococcales bacterium]|nr:hypothetical protein [Methylococcales bacterium]